MVLTGSAATEALQVYVGLAQRGARFDSRRVFAAVRTRAGRLRLAFALRPKRPSWRLPVSPRATRTRRLRVARVVASSASPPGRPRPSVEAA